MTLLSQGRPDNMGQLISSSIRGIFISRHHETSLTRQASDSAPPPPRGGCPFLNEGGLAGLACIHTPCSVFELSVVFASAWKGALVVIEEKAGSEL